MIAGPESEPRTGSGGVRNRTDGAKAATQAASGPVGRHGLFVEGASLLHQLSARPKIVGLVGFVTVVAFTPPDRPAALALDALLAGTIVASAGVAPRLVMSRLSAIVPFVAFALLLPFVGSGERTDVLGLSLSIDGSWSAATIVSKAAIGALGAIALSATTRISDILSGLSRLRVPAVLVGIAAFMFRYLDLIVDDLARMRRSMSARGHDPRWWWQARPIAASAGTMFVRTYERGERIHGAMLARGYTGQLPARVERPIAPRQWLLAAAPALVASAGLLVLPAVAGR